MILRPQWGAFGNAKQHLSANFVNQSAIEDKVGEKLQLQKMNLAAQGTRKLNKKPHAAQQFMSKNYGQP